MSKPHFKLEPKMCYPPPAREGHRSVLFVIILITLIVLLGWSVTGFGEEHVMTMETPADAIAVHVLIDQFDSLDFVNRYDEDGCWRETTPAFVYLAESCAKLDGAAPILADVLAGPWPSEDGLPMDYSPQIRMGAAIALEAIGPEAMVAWPTLAVMLHSPLKRENIMALAVIRGIGPEAAFPLLTSVRTLLYDESIHVQYWACRAVAAMGDAGEPAVADLCLLLTGDEVASVRRNACIALGEVAGCSPHLDVVCRILTEVIETDYSYPVRVEAEVALMKFYTPLPIIRPDPDDTNMMPGFPDSNGDGIDDREQEPTLAPPIEPACESWAWPCKN